MYLVYAHVNTQDCWEVSLRWRLWAWLILESTLCAKLSQVCRYHSKVPMYLHTCIMYLNCQSFSQFIPWQKCAKPSVKESKHWGAKAMQFILQLKIVFHVKVRSSWFFKQTAHLWDIKGNSAEILFSSFLWNVIITAMQRTPILWHHSTSMSCAGCSVAHPLRCPERSFWKDCCGVWHA